MVAPGESPGGFERTPGTPGEAPGGFERTLGHPGESPGGFERTHTRAKKLMAFG